MATTHRAAPARGPWHQRVMIWFFSGLLGLLIYWLLGFIVNDIGTWPGPDYREVEARHLDTQAFQRSQALRQEIEALRRELANEESRQRILRDGTDNASRTLNQLLEIQRHQVQRGESPSSTSQEAIAEAQRMFLENQRRDQEIHERITAQSEELRVREAALREAEEQLEQSRIPAHQEYQQRMNRHQWKVAAAKLAVLVPLLAVAVLGFLRYRQSLYAPAIYALGIATLIKVVLVMHAHFPRRYFKYVLIAAALVLVGRILSYLLRSAAHPRRETLLRQYREAYEHFFCPVCNFPIRRGPLRYSYWTRRSLRKLTVPTDANSDQDPSYICPSCTTPLFEECPSCHRTRHALLPACVHCGHEKELSLGDRRLAEASPATQTPHSP